MKNKAFKRTKKNFHSHAKKIILLLIFIFATFLTFALSVSASTEIRVENYNNCEKYLQKLGKEITTYTSLDTEPNKAISNDVTQAINQYRNEILALQTHKDIESRSLENEILLSYTKGLSAGHLAWIYYYNIHTFSSDISADRITAKYESCKSVIESSTQHTVLDAEYKTLAADLNSIIYSERVQNLSQATDTLASKALISGAIEEIRLSNDSDIHAKKLEELYKNLTKALSLQRARDSLLSGVKEAFLYICPQENISNSADFSLFAYNLEKSTTIKEMNSAALSCITSFIAPDTAKPYSNSAKKQYISAASTAVSRATENSQAATFEGLFDEYPLATKKSMLKDSIYALLLGDGTSTDTKLKDLESEFNGTGGRIDACSSIAEAESEFTNAKARLFLYKHSTIYEKPIDSITHEDETAAKNAIIAYTELEKETKSILLTEINIIVEKYNIALNKKILSLMPDDTLYQDSCENIISELKSIPRDDIDVFYNKISRIPQKAYALAEVINEYRNILAAEHYPSFTDIETAELAVAIDNFSTELFKITTTDFGTYSDEIDDIKSLAIRNLNITSQCARVRIVAGNSNNPAVLEEVTLGCDKIKICTSKGEMVTQANRAIFKIQRHLTSDEITKRIGLAKEEITSLKFVTEEEMTGLVKNLEGLNSFSDEAKSAENAASLETIWKKFLSTCEDAINKANAIDLSRAIAIYLEKIVTEAQNITEKLGKLEFIDSTKRDELYNLITTQKDTTSTNISSCKTTEEVVKIYEDLLKVFDNILILANEEDLFGYKEHLLSEFDKYDDIKQNYSEENYNKIIEIKEKTKEDIKPLQTKEECKILIDAAHLEISKINNLLDDEKDLAIETLNNALETYKSNAVLYSSENLTKIETMHSEATARIEAITEIEQIASVNETLLHYIALMKGVNKDFIYTCDDALSISTPTIQYPENYDISTGLWGSINKADSLLSDATFEIKEIQISNIDEISKLIQKAAKKGTITSSTSISKDKQKLLSSSKIAITLDLNLSKANENESDYIVKMLLPQNLLAENILGIAIVHPDDSVEFLSVEQTNSILSVNFDTLSRCYVIIEGTLNVKPLLMFLIFLLIAEFIILMAIIYLRTKRKKGDNNNSMSNFPVAGFVPSSIALTKIYPQNGILLSVFLSIAAIALGAAIILLIKKEKHNQNEEATSEQKEQKMLSAPTHKHLLQKGSSKYSLTTGEKRNENSESDKVFCTVGASNYYNNYNAEIDLDTIARNFNAGETVNMQTLKRKGLIAKDAKSVKILAKGRLTKPLRVEANEFSTAAKKILELSGGEAKEIK